MEVLVHLFIVPGKLLKIDKSYDKCRLFVGNIPETLSYDQVQDNLRTFFPDMLRLVLHRRDTVDGRAQNRGFTFVDFIDHQTGKSSQTTGVRTSNSHCHRPLKIVWAVSERSSDGSAAAGNDHRAQTRTLFIRNVNIWPLAKRRCGNI